VGTTLLLLPKQESRMVTGDQNTLCQRWESGWSRFGVFVRQI